MKENKHISGRGVCHLLSQSVSNLTALIGAVCKRAGRYGQSAFFACLVVTSFLSFSSKAFAGDVIADWDWATIPLHVHTTEQVNIGVQVKYQNHGILDKNFPLDVTISLRDAVGGVYVPYITCVPNISGTIYSSNEGQWKTFTFNNIRLADCADWGDVELYAHVKVDDAILNDSEADTVIRPIDVMPRISGTVNELWTAQPVTGATVTSSYGISDTTDSNGYFELYVPWDWSGTITATKSNWDFSNSIKSYSNIKFNLSNEYIAGNLNNILIKGYVRTSSGSGMSNVLVYANNGGSSDYTDSIGFYSLAVPYEWEGRVFLSEPNYSFNPPNTYYYYGDTRTNLTNQNYTGIPDPPSITTNSATNPTQNGATLNATVNPNGSDTTVSFHYGLSTPYNHHVTYGTILSGTTNQSVPYTVSNLTCGATYYYRAKAESAAGTDYGANVAFNTSPCATLTGLTIEGYSSVSENSTTSYKTKASWSDGTTSYVTYGTDWDEDSPYASIDPTGGTLTTLSVTSDQNVTITATYIYDGVTMTATKTVTIVNTKVLTGLSISGPTFVDESSSATYTAKATWDDGTKTTAAADWSLINAFGHASINSSTGVMTTNEVSENQQLIVAASYSYSAVTINAELPVTIVDTNAPPLNSAALPFTEDFEGGSLYSLPSYWSYKNTWDGRMRVISANGPHGGSYHLVMDDDTLGFSSSLNELILTINLSGKVGVKLSFYHKEFSDSNETMPNSFIGSSNSDGVAISADGNTWYKVQGLTSTENISKNYKKFTVDLDAAIATAGISYNNTFKIKFQRYGNNYNTSIPNGFAFDDIQIVAIDKNDLVMDFGPYGTYIRYNDSTWVKLHNLSPEVMATADMDSSGKDEVVMGFLGYGTYVYYNDSTWTKLHSLSPELIATGDLDGNGLDDLIASFATYGTFVRYNDCNWMKLHSLSPEIIATGDIDGNGMDEVIMGFAGYGTYVYYNNSTWTKLHNLSPELIATGDLDGIGSDEVIMGFGAYGTFVYYNGSTWAKLHNLSPELIATGDLDGNGMDEVIMGFPGYGTFVYYNNSTWTKLHNLSPELIATGDLDGIGGDEVIMDFPGYGTFVYYNDSTWTKLHPLSPDNDAGVVAGNIDGN